MIALYALLLYYDKSRIGLVTGGLIGILYTTLRSLWNIKSDKGQILREENLFTLRSTKGKKRNI